MSLALLSGVNPRVCKNGPRVRLHEGSWKLSTVGLVDSKLALLIDGVEFSIDKEFNFIVPFVGQLIFLERGTEEHFSVFAEPVKNGTVISTT